MHASDAEEEITGINVTPLVDIMLVLLVIFMATAQFISHRAVQLALPKVAASEAAPSPAVQVSLAADGTTRLNGEPVDREALMVNLRNMASLDRGLRVTLAADEKVEWGGLAALLDDVKSAGVERVAAEVRPKAGERRG